jgi:hypothetical protein
MIYKNDPAMPVNTKHQDFLGLTIRQHFASQCQQAIMSNSEICKQINTEVSKSPQSKIEGHASLYERVIAELAVMHADALITALNKEK